MSFRVVHGSGGSAAEAEPRTTLHLVPLPSPAPVSHGGLGRHRLTSFAVTVDDLIERECASTEGRTLPGVLALAARRGLLVGYR